MYLSRLFINNYRSIDRLDLRFREGKNIIVGKNNAGKSNIVRAIDLVLGENSPTYNKSENITANDFHNGDTTKDLIILVELSRNPGESLNYTNINKCFGYYILGNYKTTKSDRFPLNEDYDDLVEDIKSIFSVDFDAASKIYVNPKLKNQEAFKDQLDNKYQFAYLFYAKQNSESGEIEKDMRFLYREDDKHEWVVAQRANIRNELLQSAIIPAFRDPQNQLRVAGYTWYGKLLQNYVDTNDLKLKKAFEGVRDASNVVFKELKSKINDSHVKVAFPDTEISFQFNPDTKQDIYKSALIYVDDGFNSLLQDKGSGIQSAVVIGLFDFYVRNVAHVSSSLLAIEEPELYLHPHGRRVISNRLEDFLENQKNQVIITTHSPEFIMSTDKDINIILVKKTKGKTNAKTTLFENPKEKRLLLKGQNSEMFFADYVILVEGGEKYVFEVIARAFGLKDKNLGGNWLDEKNISIISVSGKSEFLKYSKKLDELKIPWVIWADFDFIPRCLSEFLTGRSVDSKLIQKLNTLKSEISQKLTPSKEYKKFQEIPIEFHSRVKDILTKLLDENVFIFSGELEDFYKKTVDVKCSGLGKEEKAICVASEIVLGKESELIEVTQINEAFDFFIKKFLFNS